MNELVEWTQDREYYRGQIQFRREIPARKLIARPCEIERRLTDLLANRGIDGLYAHQTDAIKAVRNGQDIVLATPAASGKSFAHTIPAIERAHKYDGRTLYIGPQVALIDDQETMLSGLAIPLDDLSVTQYTGSLSSDEHRQARDEDPFIVLTTPDMLCCELLNHTGGLWRTFFESSGLVVIDEVHECRGTSDSHVGLVYRRLAQICDRLDADPQFMCCSAAIGNPREHAATIAGQPTNSFELVDKNTSETSPTH